MKAYSAADLLGRDNVLSNSSNFIVYWFNSLLEKKTIDIELSITVPHAIYLRTRLICDYIQSVYEIDLNTGKFLDILYMDFIHRNMKKHNPSKMYEELTKYDMDLDDLAINDHKNNKVYTVRKKHQSNIELGISFSKKNIERGEMILAELDEVIGKYMTVEKLLSRLWIGFIQSFSDGNNERAIEKIIKMAAKNF